MTAALKQTTTLNQEGKRMTIIAETDNSMISDDFRAGFKHAQDLALWVLQYNRERGETDIRGHKSWIGSLTPDTTIAALKAETGELED